MLFGGEGLFPGHIARPRNGLVAEPAFQPVGRPHSDERAFGRAANPKGEGSVLGGPRQDDGRRLDLRVSCRLEFCESWIICGRLNPGEMPYHGRFFTGDEIRIFDRLMGIFMIAQPRLCSHEPSVYTPLLPCQCCICARSSSLLWSFRGSLRGTRYRSFGWSDHLSNLHGLRQRGRHCIGCEWRCHLPDGPLHDNDLLSGCPWCCHPQCGESAPFWVLS